MEKVVSVIQEITDSSLSSKKRLSVVHSIDSLSCFWQDAASEKWNVSTIALGKKDNPIYFIEQLVKTTDAELKHVFYDHPDFTLVPRSLFTYSKNSIYLRNVSSSSAWSQHDTDQLIRDDITNVYLTNIHEGASWNVHFSDISTKHVMTQLIQSSWKFKGDILYCYLMHESLYIILREKSQLTLCSRFSYETSDDVLYWITKIVDENDFVGTIDLSGFIESDSTIYHSVRSRFGNTSLYKETLSERILTLFTS